jgi:hypothetical protein
MDCIILFVICITLYLPYVLSLLSLVTVSFTFTSYSIAITVITWGVLYLSLPASSRRLAMLLTISIEGIQPRALLRYLEYCLPIIVNWCLTSFIVSDILVSSELILLLERMNDEPE